MAMQVRTEDNIAEQRFTNGKPHEGVTELRKMTHRTTSRLVTTDRVLIDSLTAIQVVAVGIAILFVTPARLADAYAVLRSIGIGIAGASIAAVIFQSWRPVPDGLSVPADPPSARALKAATSVLAAFAVIAAIRMSAIETGAVPAPLLLWAVISAVCAAALQLALRHETRIVIVGAQLANASLRGRLADLRQQQRITIVASIDPAQAGWRDRLVQAVTAEGADTVILPPGHVPATLGAVCDSMLDTNARVRLVVGSGDAWHSPFASALAGKSNALELVDLLPPPLSGWRRACKRGLDITLVVATGLFLAPFLALVALAIRLESPGPALFRQWRFGQGSRPVLIFKFRTMRADAGDATGAARTLARDPRVTRVGRVLRRLSIDELPQLLNVLRGEMSLVGPRPHPTQMQVEGVSYAEAVDTYRARHRMLPGITGWAQVNGSRGEVDTLDKARRRVELDLWYIANWSPLLDLRIIMRTAMGGFATLRAD